MTISKEEAAEKLRMLGYDAAVRDGIVDITLPIKEYENLKGLKQILKAIGYEASWGVHPIEFEETR